MRIGHLLLGATAPAAGTLSYIGTTGSTADLTTYTLSGVSIGAADSTRVVVVTVNARLAGAASRTISSASIGGTAATIDAQANDASGNTCGVFRRAVPTGTTADIAVTFSGAMSRMNCGVYTITGGTVSLVQAVGEANYQDDASLSASLSSAEAGDLIVAGAGAGIVTNFAWTGATEDYETQVEIYFSGASDVASGATTVAATIDGNTVHKTLIAAAYRVA